MSNTVSPAAPAAGSEPLRQGDAVDALFFVTATSDPGMVPRLVEPFSKLGVVPARVHISSENGAGEELSADLRAPGVTRTTAHLIDKALRRIVGVRQVIAVTE